MSAQQVALHWSGGKDSALALSLLLAQDDVTVSCLLTTIHAEPGTSTVHGLPVALLEAQASSIGILCAPSRSPERVWMATWRP